MRAKLIKLVDLLFEPIYGKKEFQPFFGFLHSLSLKGMNLRYRPIGDNGENWVLRKIHQHYQNRGILPTVFDVGANSGMYSLEVLNVFANNVVLHAFEPSVKIFESLEANLNHTDSRVNVYNFGFSDENKKVILYLNERDDTTNSLFPKENGSNNLTEEIEVKTLDSFCDARGISQVHFLKLDVEGNELSVLKGGMRLTTNGVDFIQFEFGPRNVDSRTFMRDFQKILGENYAVYRILRNGLCSITPYHQDYEAFFAGNYLAISRNVNISEFK